MTVYLGVDATDGDILLAAERIADEMGLPLGTLVHVPLYLPMSLKRAPEHIPVPSSAHTAIVRLRDPIRGLKSEIVSRPPETAR